MNNHEPSFNQQPLIQTPPPTKQPLPNNIKFNTKDELINALNEIEQSPRFKQIFSELPPQEKIQYLISLIVDKYKLTKLSRSDNHLENTNTLSQDYTRKKVLQKNNYNQSDKGFITTKMIVILICSLTSALSIGLIVGTILGRK